MKPVYQTILHGSRSNCMQAVVASIFELPLDDVPNFVESDDWLVQYREFLRRMFGLYPITILPNPDVMVFGYHEIAVETERGVLHGVVGLDGEIVHDPYPGGSKITKIHSYTIYVSECRQLPVLRKKKGGKR